MQYFETVIGQLDLASTLLDKQAPLKSRLALILVDNAVEFMLHRYALDTFAQDASLRALEERQFSAGARDKVLSHYFDPKVTFARTQHVLSDDEACFCHHAHPFRNEAYHQGILHDDIVLELAMSYHALACDFLPRVGPRSMTRVIGRSTPPVVRKHLGSDDSVNLLSTETLQRVADSLDQARPRADQSLGDALESTATKRVSHIKEGLEHILRNDPRARSQAELVRELQYWHDYYAMAPEGVFVFHEKPGGGVEIDPGQKTAWLEAREYMRFQWHPRVSLSTIARWERRASELALDSEPGRLLQKYRKLIDDLESFESMVENRCAGLDFAIEQAVEEARERERDL